MTTESWRGSLHIHILLFPFDGRFFVLIAFSFSSIIFDCVIRENQQLVQQSY